MIEIDTILFDWNNTIADDFTVWWDAIQETFSYCEYHALSKTKAISQILNHEKIRPEQCCFVGDAPSDINHGKKAGVVSIAFLNGNVPEDLVIAAKPDFSIRSFEEIRKIIEERK